MFTDIFIMCAHIFVFGYTFNWWGQGNLAYIALSISMLACIGYSLALAFAENEALVVVYNMRYYWLGFMLIIIAILTFISFFAIVAFQISDHIAIY